MSSKPQNLAGMKFDKLTAIECVGRGRNKSALWRCRCDCGNEVQILSISLKQERPHSCLSCKMQSAWNTRPSHKESNTRLYSIYYNMRKRCEKKNAVNYSNYGGRGITVCDEWSDYKAFSEWAKSSGYSDNLTLERIYVNKGYSPENCCWATYKEQANNTRANHWIEHDGKRMTLTEWANVTGLNKTTIFCRLKRGWSAEKALTTPT